MMPAAQQTPHMAAKIAPIMATITNEILSEKYSFKEARSHGEASGSLGNCQRGGLGYSANAMR